MLPTSIDEELIRSIINRVIGNTLKDKLGLTNPDHAAKKIEWCPVWTRDKRTKRPAIARFKVRLKGAKYFMDLNEADIKKSGLGCSEIYEYLQRSDAIRVKISS